MIYLDSIVNSVFNSMTYLIHSDNSQDLYIVDCGDAQPIINYVHKYELTLRGIFLTHTHFDHIYGLNEVVSAFPQSTIYTSEHGKWKVYILPSIICLVIRLRYHISFIGLIMLLSQIENASLPLFDGVAMQVLSTPGHDWSCLSYLLDRWLFTGDSLIPNTRLLVHFPKSDKTVAYKQYERLQQLTELNKLEIKSGHYVHN